MNFYITFIIRLWWCSNVFGALVTKIDWTYRISFSVTFLASLPWTYSCFICQSNSGEIDFKGLSCLQNCCNSVSNCHNGSSFSGGPTEWFHIVQLSWVVLTALMVLRSQLMPIARGLLSPKIYSNYCCTYLFIAVSSQAEAVVRRLDCTNFCFVLFIKWCQSFWGKLIHRCCCLLHSTY